MKKKYKITNRGLTPAHIGKTVLYVNESTTVDLNDEELKAAQNSVGNCLSVEILADEKAENKLSIPNNNKNGGK